MSITIQKDTYSNMYSKNHMVVKMYSDQYILTPGVKGVWRLVFTSAVPVGAIVTITIGTLTFTYTAVSTAPVGYQFSAGLVSIARNSLINVLLNNYYLSSLLGLSNYSTTGITFTEIVAGSLSGFSISCTSGYTFTNITAPVSVVYNPNFKLWLQLHVEELFGSNIYKPLTPMLADVIINTAGYAESLFDLHAALSAYVAQWKLPTYNMVTAFNITGFHNKRYFYRYAEYYGSPTLVQPSIQSAVKHILHGGISYEELRTHPDFINSYLPTRFLTWFPNGSKIVDKNQQEYLYFYFPSSYAPGPVSYRVQYRNSAGVWSSYVAIGTLPSAAPNQYWIIPAGYTQLNLETVFGTTDIVEYKIKLTNSIATEEKHYIVNYERCNPETIYILFWNSLGGMDTVRCNSKWIKEVEGEDYLSERYVPHDYNIADGQIMSNYPVSQKRVRCGIGYSDDAYRDYIARELRLTEAAWEIRDEEFIPILIDRKSLQYDESQLDLMELPLEYKVAYREHSFTPNI